MISVIIPVFNEPEINKTISALEHQPGFDFEIIVVDGEPESSTLALISNPSVVKLQSAAGRAIQMNKGARAAKGNILIFLHADTTLPVNAFKLVKDTIKAGFKVGAFDLKIVSQNRLLQNYISKSSSIRSRLLAMPYGDQAHFFKRDFFIELGGYPNIPLMEDLEIMRIIKKRKEPIFIIPKPASTSDRRWQKEGILFVMLRNPILATLYMLGISADVLKRYYP